MKLKTVVFAALLAVTLAAGCGQHPPLRVGLLVWPAYEPPYLARHLGYYEGLDLQLVEFHTPAEVLRAYRSEGIDVVAVTIDYLIQLAERDPSQRAIMVINVSNGADALLARPGIDGLEALRGRRVGVERSALGAYMLTRMLDHAGLARQAIEVVSVDVPDAPSAYREGRVDAVVTYEPYRGRILEAGAVELFSSRDIPGEIVDVLVTRESVIETRAADLRGLIDGWLQALDYLESRPREAAPILARRQGVSPEAYLRTLDHIVLAGPDTNRRMLGGESPALHGPLTRTLSVMKSQSFVLETFPVEPLIDDRFFRSSGG